MTVAQLIRLLVQLPQECHELPVVYTDWISELEVSAIGIVPPWGQHHQTPRVSLIGQGQDTVIDTLAALNLGEGEEGS